MPSDANTKIEACLDGNAQEQQLQQGLLAKRGLRARHEHKLPGPCILLFLLLGPPPLLLVAPAITWQPAVGILLPVPPACGHPLGRHPGGRSDGTPANTRTHLRILGPAIA